MSAFIISRRTMDVVVTALQDTNHSASCRVFAGEVIGHDSTALDRIGRKLWDLNARAVQGRYAGQDAMADEGFAEAQTYRWTGTYWPTATRQQLRCRYFKAIHCLRYQCAEDATYQDPLFIELTDVWHQLGVEIVTELPDYQAAPWDFQPEHVPAVTRLI